MVSKVRRKRPEDDEARQHVIPAYAQVGFSAFVHSTRNKPTGVTPGIADLEIFAPAYGFRFVHEVKIGTDRQSHEQKRYQEACAACGIAYVLGDREAAEDVLVWLGFAFWRPRGILTGEARPDLLARVDRIYLLKNPRPKPTDPRYATMADWNGSELAAEHNARWGWKATPGALRKLFQ